MWSPFYNIINSNSVVIGILKTMYRLPKRRSGKYKKGNAQILESGDDYIEPTHQVIAHVIEEHIEGYEGITLTKCGITFSFVRCITRKFQITYLSRYGESFKGH